jgi:excisionase family DNA binding protein
MVYWYDILRSEVLEMSTNRVNSNEAALKFLNVKEVAELLRIKPRTVYEMVSQGRIPYRKAGDRTIFLLEEILEWTRPNSKH